MEILQQPLFVDLTKKTIADLTFSEATVRILIQRFEELGTVEDRPRSGRPRVSEEAIEDVAGTIVQFQSESSYGNIL